MTKFLKLLFQLILSPQQGWKDMAADLSQGLSVKNLAAHGFFPLLGVMSLSVFLQGLYHPGVRFVWLLQIAIVQFMSYFLTFLMSRFLFGEVSPRFFAREDNERHISLFVIFSLAVVAIAELVSNCIPIEMPLKEFMAIYAAIIMWRGSRFMTLMPDSTGPFMGLCICTALLPVFILEYLFRLIVGVA